MRIPRALWWLVVVAVSAGVVALDLATGPYIQFPILFIVPVGLAAWHLGRWPAVGFTVVLVGARLGIALGLEDHLTPHWAAVVNAVIRLLVLLGLVVVVGVVQQRRALAARVQELEGILPICSFCKKIRREDGSWEQVEVYVSRHSAAHFSHGLCDGCLKEHYPEHYHQVRAESPPTA